jgi:hypothetical protein
MKLRDFIICDDIRLEAGSKLTLVGVYHDTIGFQSLPDQYQKWPKVLKVAFFVRIEIESADEVGIDELSFNVIFDPAEEIEVMRGKIEVPKAAPVITLSVVHGAFSFPRETRAQFVFRFYKAGQKFREVFAPSISITEQAVSQNVAAEAAPIVPKL